MPTKAGTDWVYRRLIRLMVSASPITKNHRSTGANAIEAYQSDIMIMAGLKKITGN
jgi:hypothetical protein